MKRLTSPSMSHVPISAFSVASLVRDGLCSGAQVRSGARCYQNWTKADVRRDEVVVLLVSQERLEDVDR